MSNHILNPEHWVDRYSDYLYNYTITRVNDPELVKWVEFFEKDKQEAALSFWSEIHKGILESLREF